MEKKFSLLLSKNFLKKARTVPDNVNDKAKIFNKNIDLNFSATGHYCTNIFLIESAIDSKLLVLKKDLLIAKRKSQVLKIYRQFGHVSAANIKKLINNTGWQQKRLCDIIENVVASCDTCTRFKKTKKLCLYIFKRDINKKYNCSEPWYLKVKE